jgi:hypothetical protein
MIFVFIHAVTCTPIFCPRSVHSIWDYTNNCLLFQLLIPLLLPLLRAPISAFTLFVECLIF